MQDSGSPRTEIFSEKKQREVGLVKGNKSLAYSLNGKLNPAMVYFNFLSYLNKHRNAQKQCCCIASLK